METNKLSYKIRPATKQDADDIIAMIEELAIFEKMLDQCKLTAEQLRKDGFGENPAFHSLVAEVQTEDNKSKVVGYALYYYIYSTWKGKNVYLEDLYVKEAYRKQGIGSDLMKSVAKTSLDNGCVQYRFACIGWNKSALDFYKACGACDLTDAEDWHMLRFEKDKMLKLASNLK